MRSCEWPRKRSASEALPSSVSKRYCLSIRTHGSSCRCRVISSLRRVSLFDFNPGQLATLKVQCVAQLRELLFLHEKLLAGGQPFLLRDDLPGFDSVYSFDFGHTCPCSSL